MTKLLQLYFPAKFASKLLEEYSSGHNINIEYYMDVVNVTQTYFTLNSRHRNDNYTYIQNFDVDCISLPYSHFEMII